MGSRSWLAIVRLIGIVTLLVGLLSWLGPAPTAGWGIIDSAISSPASSAAAVDLEQLATAVVTVLGWLFTGWLALGGGVIAACSLSGRAGALCQGLSGWIVPGLTRQLITGILGVSLLASASTPAIADPGGVPRQPAHSVNLDWPISGHEPPALAEPEKPVEPQEPPVRNSPAATEPARSIVVQPGESLWGIVARELGPQASPARVAQEWPHWWSANREVIGEDPDLIKPGQRLSAPS